MGLYSFYLFNYLFAIMMEGGMIEILIYKNQDFPPIYES